MTHHASLLDWFDTNKRDLPWRRVADPYAVWVSEIMLQQTQVATVIPYFERWMVRFPSVESLAAAQEDDVLSLWQGLGYYRRCRLLLQGARWVAEHGMPHTAAEWLKVPGVGRYTAGAIASIACGDRAAVVDGNVERVFARLTGSDASGAALNRAAWKWAEDAVPPERPGDWNQALMELGATVCRPRDWACTQCPLASHCVARRDGRQCELPVNVPKAPVVILTRTAYVHVWQGRYGLERIPPGEWWEGMWRFPSSGSDEGSPIGVVKHTVTNHRISMTVFLVEAGNPGLTWFAKDELAQIPLPAPQRRALEMAQSISNDLNLFSMLSTLAVNTA